MCVRKSSNYAPSTDIGVLCSTEYVAHTIEDFGEYELAAQSVRLCCVSRELSPATEAQKCKARAISQAAVFHLITLSGLIVESASRSPSASAREIVPKVSCVAP